MGFGAGCSVLVWGLVSQAGVPPRIVAFALPVCEFDVGVLDRGEGIDVEELVVLARVERFDVNVLLSSPDGLHARFMTPSAQGASAWQVSSGLLSVRGIRGMP